MSLKKVLAPAIKLAEGFPVSQRISRMYGALKEKVIRFPETAQVFYRKGKFPGPGEILVQEELGRTLKLIAEKGCNAFYNGVIGRTIVEYVQERDGILTEEDLARYTAKWTKPISTTYRSTTVYSHPPDPQV